MRKRLARAAAIVALATSVAGAVSAGTASARVADIGLWSPNTQGVLCVQWALNEYYDEESYTWNTYWVQPDGSFGPKTQQAVKWFQEHVNALYGPNTLAVDGIVGPMTGSFLQNYWYHAAGTIGPRWLTQCDSYVPGQLW